MLTGKRLNLSKMWIFGSNCYAYKHDQKKLDPRCDRGVFVGRKVTKHRLVKFIKKISSEEQTQTEEDDTEIVTVENSKSGVEKSDRPHSEDSTDEHTLNDDENKDVQEHGEMVGENVFDESQNKTDAGLTQDLKQCCSLREKRHPK